MTQGERIAWIWVWAAVAVVALAGGYGAWRFWALPYIYFEAHICELANDELGARACERVVANEATPDDLRVTALRRAVAIADGRREWFTVIKRVTSLVELGKATAEDLNLRGNAYFTLRDYKMAAKDYEQAVHMDKSIATYWSNLADAQVEMRKYAEAFDNYTTAIVSGRDTAEVLGNRGWASYQLGNYEKALADYSQAISQDGQHADNLNERGLVRHAMGDYESALADFDRSLELKSDEPIILTNRAVTFARIGNTENARRDLDRAIARDPNYESARVEKAWLLIDDGQPEGALAELQALERNGPLTISALEARSRAHLGLGYWRDTIADADRALALGSTFDWPYEYRAKAKRGLGDYAGSIADFTILVTRNPKAIGPLTARAITLELAGRTQAALDEMGRVIAENSDPTYSYEIRSRIQLHSGHIKDALSDARQAVALSPQSSHSAATLGWVLLHEQEPTAAVRECSRSLTIERSAEAYACRALAELALQKTEAALEDAKLALGLDKRSGAAHMALGRVDLAQGRAALATERFSAALKFDVYYRAELFMYRGDAEAALGHLENARSDYEAARKFDTGLHRPALNERLAKLAGQ
jgi:tetratricopeptide (TPR) repeat protein